MKLKIVLATILLPMFAIAQNVQKTNLISIAADIRGHACGGGFGLCSAGKIVANTSNNITAQKIAEQTVLFIINKASLTLENQKSLTGKELSKISASEKINFIQETNVIFDSKTLLDLGFDPKYSIIKTGNYPMIIEADKVLVTFTLSE